MSKAYPISICMAGAVSAGAYSAGVMAELLSAIRLWQNNKDTLPDCPTHDIEIKGFSGASAGSIQAVLSTLDMFAASESQELGKKAWFSANLDKMFDLSDLQGSKTAVKSVLNSDSLKVIADNAVEEHRWGAQWPNFIAKPFKLRLSVTNLRGIPFKVTLPEGNATEFGMSTHNEYMRYAIDENDQPECDCHTIQFGSKHKFDFDRLVEGALASSAFPLAFAPVELKRPKLGEDDYYTTKQWLDASSARKKANTTTVDYEPVLRPPYWNPEFGPAEDIVAVDGGATNNEPLIEAFKVLFSDELVDWRVLKDDQPVGRVLMIDPFPNEVDRNIDGSNLTVDKALGKLISALIGHARFSEPLMVSKQLQNRVGLVYPSLPWRTGKKLALRSGALGGFTGFLKKTFLEHDYVLGRLNMRRFLRYHFTLNEDNKLFDSWDAKDTWRVKGNQLPIIPVYQKNQQGEFEPFNISNDEKTKYYEEALEPFTAKFTQKDRAALRNGLKMRLKKVGKILLSNHAGNDSKRYNKLGFNFFKRIANSRVVKGTGNFIVRQGWTTFGAGFLTNTVIRTVENELAAQDYLDYKISADDE